MNTLRYDVEATLYSKGVDYDACDLETIQEAYYEFFKCIQFGAKEVILYQWDTESDTAHNDVILSRFLRYELELIDAIYELEQL